VRLQRVFNLLGDNVAARRAKVGRAGNTLRRDVAA